jgi:hypothetical protein
VTFLVPIVALAMAQQSPVPQTYAACIAAAEPVFCVTDLAITREPEQELNDLIAAGAWKAARLRAPARGKRIAELAARVAAGESVEGVSPREAQYVLGVLSDVDFYDSGLPEDARAAPLWDIALREPVDDIELRGMLVEAAVRSNREDLAERLVAEAPVNGRWSDDERAEFASIAAHMTHDWRVAEAFLASGGERAETYAISEIRLAIDRARLHRGYDREAAARVLAGTLADDRLSPWPESGPEALKAAGATDELRALAVALVERGRATDRAAEERTDDFGQAAWTFRAIGDRDAALAAAREGMAFVPTATAGRSGRGSSHGTRPARELFELAPDEAVASGMLWDYDRYEAVLRAGGRPDPEWVADYGAPFSLELATWLLRDRRDPVAAHALLDAVEARLAGSDSDPDSRIWWRIGTAEHRMILSAVTGDGTALDAVFHDALSALDETYVSPSDALRLAVDYREARVLLATLQTTQSP